MARRFGDDSHYTSLVSATKDFDKKSLDVESQVAAGELEEFGVES